MTHTTKKFFLLLLASTLTLSSIAAVLGQTPNPTITDNGWQLTIHGAVTTPMNFSLPDLTALPYTETYGDLYCEGVLIANGNWGGVSLQTLLETVGIYPTATDLEFYASDGYRINVAVAAVEPLNLMIAYQLNGAPLAESLRLVVAGATGNYWISMITEIDVTYSDVYNIAPPPVPNPIIVTPPPELPPTPQPTITLSPTTEPTPPPTATPTPELTLPPSSTPTQPPTSSSAAPTQNQPTPSPTDQAVGNQQTQPTPSPNSNLYWNLWLTLGIIIAAIAIAGLVVIRRARRGAK
jgi:DMSO/TMAO reductase YedYZ molybdopterin-dependent catalytic subunit